MFRSLRRSAFAPFEKRIPACVGLSKNILFYPTESSLNLRWDPQRKHLRKFTNPTLFYAPGAEQQVFIDAIKRANPITNLIILGGDAAWCEKETEVFS